MSALRNLCLCAIAISCTIGSLHAQLSSNDSILLKTSINNVLAYYDQNIGEQSGKFNGSQNIGYPQGVLEKNPYFQSPNFAKGYILYDQVFYNNVSLIYDEAADLVVMQDSVHRIELISDKLEAFGIADNHFRYLIKKEKDIHTNDLVSTGYYQILVDNTTSLYTKEVKKITEKILGTEVAYTIGSSTYFFIKKEGRFYEIQNKKGLFRLLKDKEKDIKAYIKTKHLKYRKDKTYTLSSVVEYYNLITK